MGQPQNRKGGRRLKSRARGAFIHLRQGVAACIMLAGQERDKLSTLGKLQGKIGSTMNTLNKSNPSLLKRTIKFGITGLFVTALHITVATLFIKFIIHEVSIANGVAFCIATITSYLMHTKWSFSSAVQGKNLLRFIVVSAIGLFLSLTIPLITRSMGFDYIIGTLTVVTVLPIINFALHNFWTYR